MAWEKTPWFVGGGAWNLATGARMLAYAANSGQEGIMSAADLKVTALPTPGNQVQIAPGGCAILSRAPGAQYEAYTGRLLSGSPYADTVNISATTGSPRHDMIVARVEDPYADSDWTEPPDPTTAQYIFTRVIAGVSAGATDVDSLGLGYSAIPLARIDIPASTSAITNAMIVDLRKLPHPRTQRVVSTHALISGEENTLATANPFPVGAEFPVTVGHWSIPIPPWATRAVMIATWSGLLAPPGAAYGYLWSRIGLVASGNYKDTQGIGYDTSGGTANSRITVVAADTVTIPTVLRGTTQTFFLIGSVESASPTSSRLQATARSGVSLDVEFLEVPV